MAEIRTLSWEDVYGLNEPKDEPEDEGLVKLLQLVPEHRRADAAPLMRGWLAMVRANLTEEEYIAFCADMASATTAHMNGDADKARALLGAYGIPYDVLVTQMG